MVRRRLRSENLRQAFTIQPLLVGGNPFDTTSIYGLIHFLESAHGVHFAMGGTGALVDAMETLMTDVGIDIQLGTTVERILVADNRVTGARLSDGTSRPCDAMISDADPAHLYEHMLPTGSSRPSARLKARHAKKSMGLFVLFFGATRQYPDVAHHTIWMGPRYRDLLADIFDRKILAEDFSIYLHRPTATDPNFAPKGCDSFYALVPVPNLEAGIDWSTEGPRLQDRVVKALSRTILPDLEQHIRADFFMTPENFAADYLSPQGAGFSIAPIFRQSAWFRFHNRAEGPSNLYLVGAGTHPGAGLPGVLCSAKVVDQILPAATPGPHPHLQTTSRALQDTGSAGGGGEAEAILRYHGRSFHLASRLLGNPGRANAARLYAFCRFVDDLADTSEDPIQAGRDLRRLREDVVQQTPRSIQSADFLNLSAEVNLPIAAALSLIDTVLRELEGTRLAEQSDLITYAQGVAGTVGLMMCSVLGATDPKAKPFAVDLGIAMQLTNIARDVGEDAEMGRVYLPATWLDGLSPEQILRPDKAQQRILRQATARCLALADQYYARGLAGLKFLPIRSRCAIGVAANVYRAIGNRIAAADYRSWDHRAIVPVRVRLLIAAACLIRQLSSIGRAKATTARTEVPPTRHRVADVASNSEAP
jgi:phytoene/squalene synthetase